ncbi:hypothetical protein [Jidongwangia harbinensis]|uniref:hypothetical protein n=1 Tax=Jidongwangia harbinensis TaxID=2878561 RepID=UPI001CDA2DC8|nr:hypothetical protein [Jidongwangia harbinensis]MCA2216307.1 hypothetical protein [Jidongwangia harbinensis]MCA2217042.1 hypothetical protein [Jidongwangia harbinensis]
MALAAAWPLLALLAVAGGACRASQILTLHRPLAMLAQRQMGRFVFDSTRTVSSVVMVMFLAAVLTALIDTPASFRYLPTAYQDIGHAALIVLLFVSMTVAIFFLAYFDLYADMRWRRSWRREVPAIPGSADLLSWISAQRTQYGLRRLFKELEVISRHDHRFLSRLESVLADLDRAVEHLASTRFSSATWTAHPSVWEKAFPFTEAAFLAWLRLPDTTQRKLRWLTALDRQVLVTLAERARTPIT